jgi:hypothetical protein
VAPRKHSAVNLRDEGLDPQCHHYYPRLIRACAPINTDFWRLRRQTDLCGLQSDR